MRSLRPSMMRMVYAGMGVLTITVAIVFAVAQPADNQKSLDGGGTQIDTISPTCANVGAQVMITGHGFGAENVAIAVGGVSANLVAANGHSATFIVPQKVGLGSTTVTATNPGGQTGSIAFKVCDLLVPMAWSGEWEITINYTNATTGSLTQTDDITAFIRTDEPLGVASVFKLGTCTGSISDTYLAIQCSGQGNIATCTVATTALIATNLSSDVITGSGASTRILTGQCGPFGNASQTIQISGRRLSLDQGPTGSLTTLVRSFVPFGSLIDSGQ